MIDLQTEEIGPVAVIHFYGILTRDTLRDAEEAWNDQLERRPEVLAFDFKGLSQIDSISINHIFKLARTASERNMKLIIYDMNESLKKVFEVIRLDKVVEFVSKQKFEADYLKDV
ncbi:MAG: hypothetical protein A2176_16080 [Spirochaetes bacterium RBG_13_51_14]|nr:MAG: hypothetical protein A2176_16080 [Spirochaetes bacterium RBG_13_51_14]